MSATKWRWPARRRPDRQPSKLTPNFSVGRLHAARLNLATNLMLASLKSWRGMSESLLRSSYFIGIHVIIAEFLINQPYRYFYRTFLYIITAIIEDHKIVFVCKI